MPGALGGFDAERRVTARATAAGHLVAALFLDRQREEALEAVQALIDDALVDAVVPDDDEAVLLVGRGQVAGEARIFGRSARREWGSKSGIGGLLCLPRPGCRSRPCRVGNSPDDAGAAQCADAVLMVRPRHFGFNAETALTNRFQRPGGSEHTAAQAQAEFDAFAAALAGEGVTVCVARGLRRAAQSRRGLSEQLGQLPCRRHRGAVSHAGREPARRTAHRDHRRRGARDRISGFAAPSISRTTRRPGATWKAPAAWCSTIVERVAYACRSPRTHEQVAREWAREMGYRARDVLGHAMRAARPSTTPTS